MEIVEANRARIAAAEAEKPAPLKERDGGGDDDDDENDDEDDVAAAAAVEEEEEEEAPPLTLAEAIRRRDAAVCALRDAQRAVQRARDEVRLAEDEVGEARLREVKEVARKAREKRKNAGPVIRETRGRRPILPTSTTRSTAAMQGEEEVRAEDAVGSEEEGAPEAFASHDDGPEKDAALLEIAADTADIDDEPTVKRRRRVKDTRTRKRRAVVSEPTAKPRKKRGPRGPYRKEGRKTRKTDAQLGKINPQWMSNYERLEALAEDEGTVDILHTPSLHLDQPRMRLYQFIKDQKKYYQWYIRMRGGAIEGGGEGAAEAEGGEKDDGGSCGGGHDGLLTPRDKKRMGSLTPEKVALLESLPGWKWFKLNPNAWQEKFDELVRYKAQNGTCIVKVTVDEHGKGDGLYQWVSKQRHNYRLFQAGKTQFGKQGLTPERIRLLESIGFVWDRLGDHWNTMFDQLVEYRRTYGTCHVPMRYKRPGETKRCLGPWCQRMRNMYKQIQEGTLDGRTASLTPERIKLLDSFGFPWVVHGSKSFALKAGTGIDDAGGGGGDDDDDGDDEVVADREARHEGGGNSDMEVGVYSDATESDKEGAAEAEGWSKYVTRAGYH